MEPTTRLDIFSILLFISVGQLFLSIIFLISQILKKKKGSLLLAVTLLIFGLNIIEPVLIRTHYLYNVPHFLYIGPFFLLLIGPVIYFYVLNIKTKQFKWKPFYLLHIVPFLLVKLWKFPNFFQSAIEKKDIIKRFINKESSEVFVNSNFDITFLFKLHPLAYFLVALTIVLFDIKRKKSSFTKFHIIYVVSLTIVFAFYLFGRTLNLIDVNLYWQILAIIMFIFTTVSSYFIISDLLKPYNHKNTFNRNKQTINLYNHLKKLMISEELFLDENISLNSLSKTVGISSKVLSKIINEFEQKKFTDFINRYRIEKAKELILDEKMKHFTFEAISKQVGFSNKMTFNRAFKRHLNMTPSEYKTINKK